ncbi:MAG TPA: RNA polymerase sigma factor [Parvularculaceae bacterium]|nr:RNA polymerase sigma factor [Parvularculaceae bacterium]
MDLTDIELVALAKTGESSAPFGELARRHQASLRAFLRRLGADGAAADDVAQDAFLKAHARLQTFRGGSSFRSWLYAIAWREFLQAGRKRAARERLDEALAGENGDRETSSPAHDASLDLRRALQDLPETERAAVLLCDAIGMSHAEAAAALGAPLGTIKSQILRAREKMRAALGVETPPGEERKRDGARDVV